MADETIAPPDTSKPKRSHRKRPRPPVVEINPRAPKGKPAPAARPATNPLLFPPSLSRRRVSAASLSSGAYQRKLMAGVAVQLSTKALSSLYDALDSNNIAAIKMALEAVGIVQPKSGVSIINNNNVDARTAIVESPETGVRRRSFEQIARGLADIREKRAIAPGALTLTIDAAEPTPERAEPEQADEEE